MGRVSTVKRLPAALREAIDAQLVDGYTLDEITTYVRGMGSAVSRSALGRHKVQLEKILERSRRARDIAEVLARTMDKNGEADMVKSNTELIHAILQQATDTVADNATAEGSKGINPKDAMMLAIAVEKLARASKAGAETERLRADAATAVVDTEASIPSSKQIEVVFVQAPATPPTAIEG